MGTTTRRNAERKLPYKPRIPLRVQNAINELLEEGYTSPAQIRGELALQEREGKICGVPDERTIRTYIKHHKHLLIEDPSGPWSLAESSPDKAARVLPIAGEVAITTLGRAWPTRALAAWIDRIVAAAPDIPPWECWRMAIGFRAAEGASDEQAMKAMTIRLACRPWTPEGRTLWRKLQQERPNLFAWDVETPDVKSISVRRKEATHDPE